MIDMFVAGATARAAAEITGVNRNTVRIFYQRLRQLIASQLPNYELSGEVEADESYFVEESAKANEDEVPQAR